MPNPRDVTIRCAAPADVPPIARTWYAGWREAHLGRVPDELVRARTEDTFTTRAGENLPGTSVAEIGGAVVGFVVVAADELEQLYLDETARGAGVAGALVAAAEERIAAAGHETAWLAVVAGNEHARHFYERCGWSDAGDFVHDAPGGIAVPARRYTRSLGGTAAP